MAAPQEAANRGPSLAGRTFSRGTCSSKLATVAGSELATTGEMARTADDVSFNSGANGAPVCWGLPDLPPPPGSAGFKASQYVGEILQGLPLAPTQASSSADQWVSSYVPLDSSSRITALPSFGTV